MSPPCSKIFTFLELSDLDKFSNFPLKKLSKITISLTSFFNKYSTVCEPIKPAPPIIKNLYFLNSVYF